MPVIDHSTQPMGDVVGKVSSREMVSGEHGTEALSIRELVVEPGFEGRLHSHDCDQAMMVTEGSIQFVVGDEVRTVRSGYSMVAPPGVAHRVVNNTWVAARMLVIAPSNDVGTTVLD